MKTFNKVAAQGDVFLIRVDTPIPATHVKQAPNANNELVVAHSESGHNHVLDGDVAELYSAQADAFIQYIQVKANAEMKHLKSGSDAHESLLLTPGVYKVVRQRESTPEGFRRVED